MAELMGRIEPRIVVPATAPARSAGPALIKWANATLPLQLLPHQKFFFRRALALDGDRWAHRTILLLAGRQGGSKSTTAMVYVLWRLLKDGARLAVVTSAQRDSAREFFLRTIDLIEESPEIAGLLRSVRRANGQESLTFRNGARLKIVASNDRAPRGLACDVVVADELRTHEDNTAWAAITPTVLARPRGQILALSNMGTAKSVVLNTLRASALAGEPSICLCEWSSEPGCDLTVEAAAAAQPALGRLVTAEAISSAIAALTPETARQEILCQFVENAQTLIDLDALDSCADPGGTLASARARVCCGVDVSADLAHITLAVAGPTPDGRTRCEIAGAWSSVADARAALPQLLSRVRPKAVGFCPGPATAALGVDLRALKGARVLTGVEVAEACGSLVEQISSRRLLHPADPLMVAHLAGASRVPSGQGFRFGRTEGHHDAATATAIAVWLSRSTPLPGRLRIIVAPPPEDERPAA